MLIDMIHDNHGEPPFKTRYRDPASLQSLGYEAIVIPDALAALPGAWRASGADAGGDAANSRKPQELEAAIDAQVMAAHRLGMRIFFYGDALLLPWNVVRRNSGDFFCEDGSGRLCVAKPAVLEALGAQVAALFERWPEGAGLVMRTGEVYPEATPHMTGSPLLAGACPVCRAVPALERLHRFIMAMHHATAAAGKSYIHRAWQPGGLSGGGIHEEAAAYRALSERLPAEVTFSFKFTRDDSSPAALQRGTVNPCLLADARPKWIEFQCEREHEGKGALPNYQAPGWREFLTRLMTEMDGESAAASGAEETRSALEARFHFWGWSRGGGWGGPYVQREEWIDVNVTALAELYRRPQADPAEIATAWAARVFGVAESAPPAPAITELLMISSPTIQRLLKVAALADDFTGAVAWLNDDLLDVEAIFNAAGRAVALHRGDDAIAEKREALAGVDRIRRLFEIAAPDLPNKSQVRDLTHALAYFDSFARTVSNLFIGFVHFAGRAASAEGGADQTQAFLAAENLRAAQSQWLLHVQRYALLPGAPSMFHESNLWERTNACLAQLEAG